MHRGTRWMWRMVALLAALMLTLAACGEDTEPSADDGGDNGAAEEGATMIFGTSADPVALDGAIVSDGESIRAIDQMFETLVFLKPGTTEPEPGLATDWEISEDGL